MIIAFLVGMLLGGGLGALITLKRLTKTFSATAVDDNSREEVNK